MHDMQAILQASGMLLIGILSIWKAVCHCQHGMWMITNIRISFTLVICVIFIVSYYLHHHPYYHYCYIIIVVVAIIINISVLVITVIAITAFNLLPMAITFNTTTAAKIATTTKLQLQFCCQCNHHKLICFSSKTLFLNESIAFPF